MRYVYFKYGDAVSELKRLGFPPSSAPESGPYHYIATFLAHAAGRPVLVVSFGNRSSRLAVGTAQAMTLDWESGARGIRRFLRRLGILARAGLAVLGFRPRAALCALRGPLLLACFGACRLAGLRFIHTRHTRLPLDGDAPRRTLLARAEEAAIRRMPLVLCHGPHLEQQLLRLGLPAGRILRFDLGFAAFRSAALAAAPPPGLHRYILYVGRVSRAKGVFDLLEALHPLLADGSGLRLVLAGDGPDRGRLEELVQSLGLNGPVVLLGSREQEELAGYFRHCLCLAAPTRRELGEGCPKVVQEALAAGAPVVCPDYGNFRFLVEHEGNGLRHAPDSVAALRAAIERLANDPALRGRLAAGAEAAAQGLAAPGRTFAAALVAALPATPRPGPGTDAGRP